MTAMSMHTRKELIEAVGFRYRSESRLGKTTILNEFVELTGFHRKHAIRVLAQVGVATGQALPKQRNRVYDEAVRLSLITLWEAGDRVCGKRLKALIPLLLGAMERHKHLLPPAEIREKLLAMSAATIDRALKKTREQIDGKKRRRSGVGSAIRRSVPVRTFADWGDPDPGFFEVDMVEHCGGMKQDGNFVHTLVLTDIASGWTECIAMPARDQSLIVTGFAKVAAVLPFAMLGIDTDNDSAFMNRTVVDYCENKSLVQTRSRAYKKNDNAWVEQKNGAIVRRLVGYGKLTGLRDTHVLGQMYEAARLYINYFQPSFKLKSKTREGAVVQKKYYAPMTPCDRLMSLPNVSESSKERLRKEFSALDPIGLLQTIRAAQAALVEFAAQRQTDSTGAVPTTENVSVFLNNLGTLWKDGEARPTHRRQPGEPRLWRTRPDPFEHAWPTVEQWLLREPHVTAKELLTRLAEKVPDVYAGTSQLRTLQRRVREWRTAQAKSMILGALEVPKERA
jgi:hypothetical protein